MGSRVLVRLYPQVIQMGIAGSWIGYTHDRYGIPVRHPPTGIIFHPYSHPHPRVKIRGLTHPSRAGIHRLRVFFRPYPNLIGSLFYFILCFLDHLKIEYFFTCKTTLNMFFEDKH